MLFRLYFWSYFPVSLLYWKVGFIPRELLDAIHWPLLLVADYWPPLTARYIQLTEIWWLIDWLLGTAQFAGQDSPLRFRREVR